MRFEPQGVECRVETGTSLYRAALEAGLRLHTPCGGEGRCGRCKVQIQSGSVRLKPHPFLSQDDIDSGFCLACQTPVEQDLVVLIPEEMEIRSAAGTQTFLSMEDIRRASAALGQTDPDPWVRWVTAELSLGAAGDAGSEAEAMEAALAASGVPVRIEVPFPLLRKLSRVAPGRECSVRFLVQEGADGSRVLDLSVEPAAGGVFGLAVDLGTTVVGGALVDLERGDLVAESSQENLQAAHGADIIHRISFATHKGGLEKLQYLAVETVEGIVADLTSEAGIPRTAICALTVAGNTTMTQLLLGLDPTYIRQTPFVPVARRLPPVGAAEVGIGVHPQAPLWVSPAVANYLGGDITAGVLRTRMWDEDPLTLYVDLGTNGEIVLGSREWMAGCACSCGPAFEGSGVGCGMRATGGAIDQLTIEPGAGEVSYRVIGCGKPRGLCGSGLVDLMAELRSAGFLTSRGKFSPAASERIQSIDGKRAFLLVPAEETSHGQDIRVTERDLEHLIRSKGAAFAGVRTLLENLSIPVGRIERVFIAGGFGRSLDVSHAVEIGMLPDLPRDRFSYIGNGSLQGAVMALLWRPLRDRVDEIARRITYVDLSTTPGYMEEFVASLFLPHTDLDLFPSVARPDGS